MVLTTHPHSLPSCSVLNWHVHVLIEQMSSSSAAPVLLRSCSRHATFTVMTSSASNGGVAADTGWSVPLLNLATSRLLFRHVRGIRGLGQKNRVAAPQLCFQVQRHSTSLECSCQKIHPLASCATAQSGASLPSCPSSRTRIDERA